ELQSTGANQTIEQIDIFGKYVRWDYNMPCPDTNIPPDIVLSVIDQMIFRASGSPAGPVHLNCMFREPFTGKQDIDTDEYLKSVNKWKGTGKPFCMYHQTEVTPEQERLAETADVLNSAGKGLVVIGRLQPYEEKVQIADLTNKLNFPIFADISSGLKHQMDNYNIIYYDQLLNTDTFRDRLAPDVILHIGSALTSKRLNKFLKELNPEHYIQVCSFPERADPENVVTERFYSDHSIFCEKLLPLIRASRSDSYLAGLRKNNEECSLVIDDILKNDNKITEPGIAHHVSGSAGDGHSLYLCNSMPIRDMDMFPDLEMRGMNIGVNRGTSGIDGNIASAIGFSRISDKPLTLIIGDVTFIHNLNALEILKNIRKNINIIVINNRGGGIFSFLPVAEEKDVFTKYFTTPHDYSFAEVAGMFGIDYRHPDDMDSFAEVYSESLKNDEPVIIEVTTDTGENFRFHERIKKEIIAKIDQKE
ncbi:MAG: 2-succinyl-5-enolpyruvyl-6-hydroxy-3-cyclohexene-1-carboxylic-acid synthase, partial [bacterium]|nr:2-succinyl-5-enolpyruvyl-6-hydroxy-3-cyclohexene-1-carboxylic-acid synthase [bacterium]